MQIPRLRSERGAILIHVAVGGFVLTAFTMFVVDHGILWVSRNQAQNAADAGALAGAVALAFDDPTDHSETGPAKAAAYNFALANDVWAEDPDVDITTDIRFYQDAPGAFPAECDNDDCIRVDVFRNQARGNPLPTWFGQLVGLSTQGVRATATAQAAVANASDCLKPWAVADKWAEHNPDPNGTWNPTSTFDPRGPHPDVYVPPSATSPGTGFTLGADYGTEFVLKVGNPHDTINPGWFQALDLSPGAGGGAAEYREYIAGCSPHTWKIGDDIRKKNGNMVGPTRQGVYELIDKDPGADWDPVNQKVVGSAYDHSPRIVALPVFDLQLYLDTGGPGNGTVHVVNILGFFVDRMQGNDVVGYLVTKPDLKVANGGLVAAEASFLKAIQLVR